MAKPTDNLKGVLGKLDEILQGGSSDALPKKPVVQMTAEQARAGVRTVPPTAAGVQATKGLGRKALGLAGKGLTKYGGAPALGLYLLWDIWGKISEGRDAVAEASQPPRTAESMLRELDEDRRRRSAAASVEQNDPQMMEALRWMLSGQQKPDLTPNQVMFGATPTNQQVPPEAIREALAAMAGEA